MLLCMRIQEEYHMQINPISNANFNARLQDRNYYYEKLEEDLFTNHGIGAEEILDFQREVEKLPAGDVIIDEYVKHGGRDFIFGSVVPPCGHTKPFVVETPDSANILTYLLDKIKFAFNEKSEHKKCPFCNP